MSDKHIGVKLEYHPAPDEDDTEHGYEMPPINYDSDMVIIPQNSDPVAVAVELRRTFSPNWWARFIKAVLEMKRQ